MAPQIYIYIERERNIIKKLTFPKSNGFYTFEVKCRWIFLFRLHFLVPMSAFYKKSSILVMVKTLATRISITGRLCVLKCESRVFQKDVRITRAVSFIKYTVFCKFQLDIQEELSYYKAIIYKQSAILQHYHWMYLPGQGLTLQSTAEKFGPLQRFPP